jgi:hypothetical protein
MSTTVPPPNVTLFACCACCVAGHEMRHADPCGKHQRAEAAEAKKARRTRRPVETVELP